MSIVKLTLRNKFVTTVAVAMQQFGRSNMKTLHAGQLMPGQSVIVFDLVLKTVVSQGTIKSRPVPDTGRFPFMVETDRGVQGVMLEQYLKSMRYDVLDGAYYATHQAELAREVLVG